MGFGRPTLTVRSTWPWITLCFSVLNVFIYTTISLEAQVKCQQLHGRLTKFSTDSNLPSMSKPPSRFYSSPMNEGTSLNPVELYGLEMREPSIIEKPKLLQRVTDALIDAREDFSMHFNLDLDANKTIQCHCLTFRARNFHHLPSCQKTSMMSRWSPRSQTVPIDSFDAYLSPTLHQRLGRKMTWWSSFFAKSRKNSVFKGVIPSSPDVISTSVLWKRLSG